MSSAAGGDPACGSVAGEKERRGPGQPFASDPGDGAGDAASLSLKNSEGENRRLRIEPK